MGAVTDRRSYLIKGQKRKARSGVHELLIVRDQWATFLSAQGEVDRIVEADADLRGDDECTR